MNCTIDEKLFGFIYFLGFKFMISMASIELGCRVHHIYGLDSLAVDACVYSGVVVKNSYILQKT